MDIISWFTATASVDSLLNTLGLGALAILFATDRIMTKGQHTRRIEDLQRFHARELAEKDARISSANEARQEWKTATAIERERADKATATVGDIADSQRDILHVLDSLDTVLKEATNG